MKLLKLKPFFSERIWGGKQLLEMGFDAPADKNIGEAWVLSAHENGMCYIDGSEYNGMSLLELFNNKRDIFSNFEGGFPLLVKIIAANDYLSVQVHPDDDYALKKHNSYGKPESWYVIDCPENAELIYGHSALSKEEIEEKIKNNQWDDFLIKQPIKKGDFLYVPPGKIHAITPGVVVYELQRSSDITYRLFDYNRFDDQGNPRELHIEDSLNNIEIPDTKLDLKNIDNGLIFSSKYFSLYKLNAQIDKEFSCPEDTYWLQLTVLSGMGTINGINSTKGDCIITVEGIDDINVTGDLDILISWIKK